MYDTLPIKTKGRYSKDQSADKNSVPFSTSNKNVKNIKVSLGTRKKITVKMYLVVWLYRPKLPLFNDFKCAYQSALLTWTSPLSSITLKA